MNELTGLGRLLVATGLLLTVAGLILLASPQIPGLDRLGRLPGDLVVERGSFRLFVPIVSSIIISVILTIVLNVLIRR